jgi:hypothetical protein
MQWFFANYLYALGLDLTTVAAVNTISAVSGVFVMVLAALPILNVTEGDKFTLSRLVVTLLRFVEAILAPFSLSLSLSVLLHLLCPIIYM